MQLSPTEILVVAVIALIVLGPDKLPKAARQVGKAMAEFRKISSGLQSQVNDVIQGVENEGQKTLTGEGSEPDQPKPRNPNVEGFRLVDDNPQQSTSENGEPKPDTDKPEH